jgi:GSKIP domain
MAQRPPLTEEQTSLLTNEEYKHLKTTYTALLRYIIILPSTVIRLITLEGNEYHLKVSQDGWKVVEGGSVSERERTWEMVEDLLRSISPCFKNGWDEMLLQKLQQLADAQSDDDMAETGYTS